jgi:hypothetical protein
MDFAHLFQLIKLGYFVSINVGEYRRGIKRRRRSKLKKIVSHPIVVMKNKICLHKKEIQRKHGPTVQQQGRCMFVVVWIVAVTV